jgi:PAS domain S-box-containing protein
MLEIRIEASSSSLNVVRDVFELNILANEFLISGGERPIIVWEKNLPKVKEELYEISLTGKNEDEIVEKLVKNLDDIDSNFNELVRIRHEKDGNEQLENNEKAAIGKLLDNSQKVVDSAYELSTLAENDRATIRRTFDIALVVFVVVVGVLSTIAGYGLTVTVLKSLRKLQKGANMIAKGELDYKVEVDGKDEMAHLAKTFNEMTGRLKEIYTELDNKVKERTKELAIQVRKAESSAAKDEALLENIGEGIIGVNDGGDVVFVNREAQRLLGYEEEELVDNAYIHAISIVDEEGKEIGIEKRPIHKALLSAKHINERDLKLVKKNGTSFPADITATPVVLHGQVIGGVVVFKDITKEKEIDRMKTEFISLASHQLRTPLSAMKWFSEILLSGDAGELEGEQREMVENIYGSTERMVELVNALLNISRIESGRIIIDPEPTDLNELVNGVVKEVKQKIDEKNINFAFSAHHDLPQINIDPKLIRNVYQNLITNAIKYTPEGGSVEVLISRKEDEIISQVTDTGYGIPQQEQDRVFERFFRSRNIVKLETEGTGLGLYLAKAIVESSGGKIWFKSKEGEGTTFWFSLPIEGSTAKEGDVSIS